VLAQTRPPIGTRTARHGPVGVRAGATHQRARALRSGFAQDRCHRLAARQQPRIAADGRSERPRHRGGRAPPAIGHRPAPLGPGDGSCEAPPAALPRTDRACRPRLGCEHVGQSARPGPRPPPRDHPPRRLTGGRAGLAHRHAFGASRRPLAQPRPGAIGGRLPPPRAPGRRRAGQGSAPPKRPTPRATLHHPPTGRGDRRLRRQRPRRPVAAGHHQARARPPERGPGGAVRRGASRGRPPGTDVDPALAHPGGWQAGAPWREGLGPDPQRGPPKPARAKPVGSAATDGPRRPPRRRLMAPMPGRVSPRWHRRRPRWGGRGSRRSRQLARLPPRWCHVFPRGPGLCERCRPCAWAWGRVGSWARAGRLAGGAPDERHAPVRAVVETGEIPSPPHPLWLTDGHIFSFRVGLTASYDTLS
jgi:hypothetical protein